MQENNEDSGTRDELRFINALLQAMNSRHTESPKSNSQSLNSVKNFAQFLYQHAGIEIKRAKQEAKAFASSDKHGNPLRLKLFSLYPNNPDTDFSLACPGPEMHIKLSQIRKKFYQLFPNPDRDGKTLESKLADIIARYTQESAVLQRKPDFKTELGPLQRDTSLLIIAELKRERDKAIKQLEKSKSPEAQLAFEAASNNLKALKQTSRGLFSAVSPWNRRIALFLECVYRGDLAKVEDLLNNTPDLACASQELTDLSNRTFPTISGLQYATWALDNPMQALIKRYLSDAQIEEQLNALNHPESEVAKSHGTHWSFDTVRAILIHFVNRYDQLRATHNWAMLNAIWNGELCKAQMAFPAWLILMMCEKGSNVAWGKLAERNKQGLIQEVKRDMKHLQWWFATLKQCQAEHRGAIVRGGRVEFGWQTSAERRGINHGVLRGIGSTGFGMMSALRILGDHLHASTKTHETQNRSQLRSGQ